MSFKNLLRRMVAGQTSQHEAKLVDQLSQTETMMRVARAAHATVQKVTGHIEQIGTRAQTSAKDAMPRTSSGINSPDQPQQTPLSHEELTPADHARARGDNGSDILGAFRRVKDQVKSDAAADWNDLKAKFGGGRRQ